MFGCRGLRSQLRHQTRGQEPEGRPPFVRNNQSRHIKMCKQGVFIELFYIIL